MMFTYMSNFSNHANLWWKHEKFTSPSLNFVCSLRLHSQFTWNPKLYIFNNISMEKRATKKRFVQSKKRKE